jgi:hypothetical protein
MNREIQLKIAKLMHDEYEEYSRKVGWKTQKKCQTLFEELSPANREVMLWVAGSIMKYIIDDLTTTMSEIMKMDKGDLWIYDFVKKYKTEDYENL